MGLISSLAPSSGEIPSCRTMIMAAGTVTFGLTSTGMVARDIKPANKNSSIKERVARERLTTALKNPIRYF